MFKGFFGRLPCFQVLKGESVFVKTHFVGEKRLRTDYPFRILPFDGILGLAPSASGGSVMHASVLPARG